MAFIIIMEVRRHSTHTHTHTPNLHCANRPNQGCSPAARGVYGQVLRGLADPRHSVRREGADQARALPGPGAPAQLRGGEAEDAAERQLRHRAAVRNVVDDGQNSVRVPVAPPTCLWGIQGLLSWSKMLCLPQMNELLY